MKDIATYPGTIKHTQEDFNFRVNIYIPYESNPKPRIHIYDKILKTEHEGYIQKGVIYMDHKDDSDLITYFSGILRSKIFYLLEREVFIPTHYYNTGHKIVYFRVDLEKQEVSRLARKNSVRISTQEIKNYKGVFKKGQFIAISEINIHVDLQLLKVIKI